jgi:hypothetical protein
MSATTKHSPMPWYAACWSSHAANTVLVDDASALTGKRTIAECDREEDADFIVRACNAHEQLVDVVKEMMQLGDRLVDDIYGYEFVQKAKAALAAAGAA